MPLTIDQEQQGNVEQAVLNAVREQQGLSVLDLVDSLRGRFSTADVKVAMAELLNEGRIELTSERTLQAAA